MRHTLKIAVSKEPADGIVSCRTTTLREKLLSKLFGSKRRLTILIPGDTVESVAIREVGEGGMTDE